MVGEKPKVLIVDDEEVICKSLLRELNEQGYACTAVPDGKRALTLLMENDYDATLIDIRLPGISGMDVLRQMQSEDLTTVAVMITAVNEVDMAVEAMKIGAYDYIVKPFSLEKVETSLKMSLEFRNRKTRNSESTCYSNDLEVNELATHRGLKQIDAIARGVEIEYNTTMGYWDIIMHRTVSIAKKLEIPEIQIKRWVALRATLYQQRNRVIQSHLEKLMQRLPHDAQRGLKPQRKPELWKGIPYDRVYDRADISGLSECK